jgi:hypothetical protein
MNPTPQIDEIVEVANRTLRAAGYEVFEFQRTLNRAEFRCRITSRLGAVISFLFVFTSKGEFSTEETAELQHVSSTQGLARVLVSLNGDQGQVSWADFLRAMGGAVPSWRALQPNYKEILLTASQDTLPPGETGEAWALFEDLIADGLEFALGRRVRRFGGRRRGQKVSDMIAQLPDFDLLVVDAKATKGQFDSGWPNLRPLVEYVLKQQVRQSGLNNVLAALIVSSEFRQDSEGLRSSSDEFLASTHVPLCFLSARILALMIHTFREKPRLRNAIRWSALFTGGLIDDAKLTRLINEAERECVEDREM